MEISNILWAYRVLYRHQNVGSCPKIFAYGINFSNIAFNLLPLRYSSKYLIKPHLSPPPLPSSLSQKMKTKDVHVRQGVPAAGVTGRGVRVCAAPGHVSGRRVSGSMLLYCVRWRSCSCGFYCFFWYSFCWCCFCCFGCC